MNIQTEIEKLYNNSIPEHSNKLDLWFAWYKGFDSSFHKYTVPQGGGKVTNMERLSLKMGKSASENYANLLVNEKTDIVLPNDKDNELLNMVFEKLGFWNRTNSGIEIDYALGSGAGVINIDYKINENTGDLLEDGDWKIHYEFLDAYKVYPLSFKYGECVECAFASFGTNEGAIVLHTLDDNGNYVIKTHLYCKDKNNTDWQEVESSKQPKDIETGSPIKLFSYLKPNITNNVDLQSDVGISIFANAIDTMKAIDSTFDSYYYEFILGKKRVFASARLTMQDVDGNMVDTFDANDIGVYVLPEDDDGKTNLRFEEGTLRAEAYSRALNDYLSMFSYQCGFGKNFFSFGGEGGRPIQTATAIVAQNSDLFRNIKKQEIYIDKFLTEITQAVMFASTKWTKDKFTGVYNDSDILIRFDDSIFEDKESQKETDRKDVQLGTMSKVEFRAKWNAEDEDTAKQKLNENIDYLVTNINALIPSVQAKIVTPELFVKLIFGDNVENKQQLIQYISDNLNKSTFSAEDLMASGFGSGS